MKKLPKIYQNNINKKIKNNKEVCYLKEEVVKQQPVIQSNDVEEQLSRIFNGIGHSYNIPIIIKTSDKVYETSLIAKTSNNVITLDNDLIPIKDIINIEFKNSES